MSQEDTERPLPIDLSAAEALEPLRWTEPSPAYTAYALALARAEADTTLRPVLEEVAELHRCNSWIVFQTMLALDVSGAPSAYFLDYLDRFPHTACVAARVIEVLGVRADSTTAEAVEAAANVPRPLSDVCYPANALADFRYGLDRDRAYESLSIAEKAEVVVPPLVQASFGGDGGPPLQAAMSGDGFYEAWARRRVVVLAQEAPDLVRSVAQSSADSVALAAQAVLAPEEEAQYREAFPEADLTPVDPALAGERAAEAVAAIERTAIQAAPPAPYEPGPVAPVVPSCDGISATIYVDVDGTVVGGELDGQPYDGLLRGTDGPDVLVGTDGPDQMASGPGDDVLCGLGGDDLLQGNGDRDVLFGGPGDDVLAGGNGGDTIYGGDGTDEARGGRGNDACDAETEDSCERDPDE